MKNKNAKNLIKEEVVPIGDITYKNAANLTTYEMDSYVDVYEQYFRDLTGRPFGERPRTLKGYFERAFSRDYAERMAEKVRNYEVISYAALLNGEVKGLITGRINSNWEAWMSHFYISGNFTIRDKRMIEAKLFGFLASTLKENGIKSVYTESEFNPSLTDALMALEFEEEHYEESDMSEFRKLL